MNVYPADGVYARFSGGGSSAKNQPKVPAKELAKLNKKGTMTEAQYRRMRLGNRQRVVAGESRGNAARRRRATLRGRTVKF